MEIILNSAVESFDNQNRERRIAYDPSKNPFIKSYIKKGESIVKFGRRWAALDMLIGTVGTTTASEISGNREGYLRVTAGLYFLTGRDCSNETRYKDFGVRKGRSPAFFVLISWSGAFCFLGIPMPATYKHYAMAAKKKLAKLLRPEEVDITVNSFLSDMGTCSMDAVARNVFTV